MGEWVNERKNTGNEWFFELITPAGGTYIPNCVCVIFYHVTPSQTDFTLEMHPMPLCLNHLGWVWNRSKRTVCKHKTEAQMLLILHTGVAVLSRQCSACVHSVGNTIHTVSTASTIPEHGVVTKPVTSLRGQTMCAHEQEGRWSPLTWEFKD